MGNGNYRYLTVADDLKHQITELGLNSLLPSEDQLARRYDVSRVTIRRALTVLESSGLVDRQRGRGTVVNPPKVIRSLQPVLPIEKDIELQGRDLQTEVLSVHRGIAAPAHILEILEPERSDGLAVITMVRSVDERVISFDRRYLPDAVIDQLDEGRLGKEPTGVLLSRFASQPIVEHKMSLEFTASTPEEAQILRITPGALIVLSTGVDCMQGGLPYSVTEMNYRIDRVRFTFASRYEPTG